MFFSELLFLKVIVVIREILFLSEYEEGIYDAFPLELYFSCFQFHKFSGWSPFCVARLAPFHWFCSCSPIFIVLVISTCLSISIGDLTQARPLLYGEQIFYRSFRYWILSNKRTVLILDHTVLVFAAEAHSSLISAHLSENASTQSCEWLGSIYGKDHSIDFTLKS